MMPGYFCISRHLYSDINYLLSVATITALMVCMRFSAWSNTMLAADSKTSSVTSIPPCRPNSSAIFLPSVVWSSWNAAGSGGIWPQGYQSTASSCCSPDNHAAMQCVQPIFLCFTHRHPYIGIDKVSTFNSFSYIFRQRNIPAILLCGRGIP